MVINLKPIIDDLTERKIINKCAIHFDANPAKVYYSGQLIDGTIQLTLREKKKLRGVFAKIIGKVYVCYDETNGQSDPEFTSKEIILHERIELVHHESNGKNLFKLFIRFEEFKLLCQTQLEWLPDRTFIIFNINCPKIYHHHLSLSPDTYGTRCVWFSTIVYGQTKNSRTPSPSLEWPNYHRIGSSVFSLKSFLRISCQKLFNFEKQEPITAKNSKTFNLFCHGGCFPSEPLETFAQISCVGYLPHQTIDLHMHVNNKSSQPVTEFTVMLLRVSV